MFELDSRLKNDTYSIGEYELCEVLLMNDNQYPWLILVPKLSGVTELFQLNDNQQRQLTQESNLVASKMHGHFKADKMNVAALGNIVSQLHIHHVVRYENDSSWPGPVWGALPAKPYSKESLATIVAELRLLLF